MRNFTEISWEIYSRFKPPIREGGSNVFHRRGSLSLTCEETSHNTWNNPDQIVLGGRFSVPHFSSHATYIRYLNQYHSSTFSFTCYIYEIILISTTIPKLASWCAPEFVHKIGTAIPDRDCSGPITAVTAPMKTDLP